MAGSWRKILDSATALRPGRSGKNPEPSQPAPASQGAQYWPHAAPPPSGPLPPSAPPPSAAQARSAQQAREQLARELAGLSGALPEDMPAPAAPAHRSPAPPPAAPAPRQDPRPSGPPQYRQAPPSAPAGYRPAPQPAAPAGQRPGPPHAAPAGPRPPLPPSGSRLPAPHHPSVHQPVLPPDGHRPPAPAQPAAPAGHRQGPPPAPGRVPSANALAQFLGSPPPPAAHAPRPGQPEYRSATPPPPPARHELALAAGDPGRVPLTEEKVPYHSLMDALSSATPDILTDAEKNAGLREPWLPGHWKKPRNLRLLVRAAAVALFVLGLGLGASVFLGRSLQKTPPVPSQPGQAAAEAPPKEVWAEIPLPSRRPAGIGQESGPSAQDTVRSAADLSRSAQEPSRSGQAGEPSCFGWACPSGSGNSTDQQ